MEFEEMKKVWDSQNNETFYGINEKALHNRIISKKRQAYQITNISELLCIIVFTGTGCFVFGVNFLKQSGGIFMYILSGWMFLSAMYLLRCRIRRINADQRFDRSIRGDLANAITMATYQVRLSLFMRWNILPIGLLTLLGIWDAKKSVWITLAILVFFVLTNYAGGWEHAIYKARKRELEVLQSKLDSDDQSDRHPDTKEE